MEYLYNKTYDDNSLISNIKKDKIFIAGPCTFGSYDEIYRIASSLKALGITNLRAGVFKARTSPYSFQGMHEEGMNILIDIKKKMNVKIVVELMTIEQIEKYSDYVDIIQIGSRNMYNYELLKELGKIRNPILLKRGLMATYKEWLLAAEYILKSGNDGVILCERGIRAFNSDETRNVLDLQAIPYIHTNSNLPIIVDPSHASGNSYMVEPMSRAAIVAGCDGLIIETHTNPEESLCDSKQTINIKPLNYKPLSNLNF